MLEKRTCGGCTACCKTHFVASISKGAGVWCSHCSIGKGCKIYSDRPSECQSYECSWLKGEIQERHRPDKVKVVVDCRRVEGLSEKSIAFLWEVSEGALEQKFALAATEELLAGEMSVFHIYLNGREVFHTKKTLSQKEVDFLVEDKAEIVKW